MADRYLLWGLVGVIVVLSLIFAVAGIRRRMERGRPARFQFGFGVGPVDVIEGLTGKELSPRAQAVVFAISIAIGVMALVVGLSVLLLRRGSLS